MKAIQRHKAPGRFTLQDSFFNSISTDADLVKAREENQSFYQSAWHGSPHDFVEFLLSAIGTGEGAQVHGWGLYFAKERSVSEWYKKMLGDRAELSIWYDGKRWEEIPSEIQEAINEALKFNNAPYIKKHYAENMASFEAAIHEGRNTVARYDELIRFVEQNPNAETSELWGKVKGTTDTIEEAFGRDLFTEGSNHEALFEALKEEKNKHESYLRDDERSYMLLKRLDPEKIEINKSGKLFKVEIPDNDVLLDEQKPFDEQPKFVREKLEEMFSRADTEQLLYALSKKDPRFDEVYSDYCELLDHEQDEAYAQEIRQRYNHELSRLLGSNTIPQALLRSFASGREIYQSISDVFSRLRGDKEASLALNDVGIKGITYDGRQDGRCFVIFDDKAISIIEKFNQMLRQEVRGEISKEDGKRIITLFESADESTFMHEMGHMFLMDLDEPAKMDEASAKELETVNAWAEWHEGAAEEYEDTPWAEEFRAHEEAIRKAVAAGDVIAEKAARERWRQERFARGFELFLTEGKAPSHALRGVFRKFKEYLRKIYHFVRSVGGHPSPEVQAVMALMIATEDEIKAASLDALYRPMEGLGGKEGIKTLLGETEAETYERWLKEAQEEAEDILRARVMKDLKKEARAEVRERLDAERERKRAELENDPVHLAAAAIQAAGSEDVALNWFPSLEAYKKAHAERKPLETELAEHMEDYAKKIDTEIMTSHLTEESIVRAMQTPKAYHRRIAIEMAALRRRERMMQKVGGKEQDVHADAVAVRGDEFGAYKHIKELRDRAIAYYRNVLQGTSVENVHLGKVDIDENGLVEFTGSGRREAKSTSAKPEKLLLIKYLPKLIRGATNITENAAQKESHAGEYFYYLHTNASVDGTTVPVVITLIKRNDGSIQYYNHTLPSLEESIKKEPPVSAGPVSSNEALGTPPVGDSVVSTIPQRNMVGQVSASGVRRASPEEIRKEYERATEENVRVLREAAAWNALVDRYDAADKKKWKAQKDGKLFHVMDVPLVMQLLNIPYDSLHVFGSFFAHSVNPKHKGMTLDILRQLPRKMADPLMIIRGNDAGSYVFVVELKDTNGATVVAPVEIVKDIKSTGGIVNVINSAFGKTAGKKGDKPSLKWFDKQFKANNVLYINKNKSIAWLRANGNSSPAESANSNALSKFIVSGVGQNVKTEVDLDAAKKANPGFYQMSYGEKMALEKFNHRVVDIQFVEVDEKQALKSNFIGIRYDDNVYQLGDELENSHDWPEGNWTETELNGACAVDVMSPGGDYQDLDEFKKHAIEQLNDSNEYLNENVYLISGTSYEYGNDPNEVILSNPEIIGILKLVRWDELNEEEQERYRKQQEASDEKEEEADEVSTEQNTGVQFTYDGKDAGDLSADVFEGIELLDGWNGVHDTESLREKYDDLLAHAERTVERDKKQLANVNKAISILESAPNTTKEEFEKEFGPDSNIMMTIKYPSSDGLAADLAYEKEGIQKSINMDQHRVDVLKKIDPNKLQWKKQKTETFNQSAWHGSPHDFDGTDANIYHQKDSLDNDMADSDNESRISDAVFQKYLNDGIMEMVRDKVSAEIAEHVNLADMADPVKRDAARDSLPYIRQMLVHYNDKLVQTNPAYKNRMAVKIEYARRCFDNDPRVQHGAVRSVDGDARQGGVHKDRQGTVPSGDGKASVRPVREVPRGVSRSVSGERSGARAHFEKLYDDMQKHLESQGAFSMLKQMLRQEVRGEISKEDGKRIITLFESADESTFMHEMGHMFLMDLDELAKMDEASAKELETVNAWAEWHEGAAEEYKDTDFADEFRDHENAILAAKKSGDVVAEKAALERWRQERFACGFEMYLSEGKAPSAAMRSVFRRFKAFLRKIYNLAKNAGAMPSVEVQAVMARMIATENEIAEAKLDERFRPIEKLLGKESVESLLGETEAELYQRWTQEAQEEAEDILRKRVMNDLKKEAREEFNEKVEAERERKRAELENDPVYLAEYAMRQGGSTDVVMNWFPSYAAYKKARGKRKTLENELKDYMTEYASKLDEQIMQAHLSDENVARAMQTPKAYHRRLAIESAALRRKERLMRLLGGNAPEEVKKKAVAEAKKAESPTRRGTKQEVRKDIRRLHQMHGYP